MTMPHLSNCPHSDEGWCLSCVGELYSELEKESMKKQEPIMLPCPFCQSENLEICVYYVACRECNCQGPLVDVYTGPIPRREQVIDAWNKRAAK